MSHKRSSAKFTLPKDWSWPAEPSISMAEYSGKPVRPRFQIYSDQLRFLLSSNFSVTDTAKFFGVSVRTVYGEWVDFHYVSNLYSTVTDQELDAVLRDILIDFPKTGYRRMLGHLKARGIGVQEKRVRRIFHSADLEGAIKRCIS